MNRPALRVSARAYAKHIGCSHPYVLKLVQRGIIRRGRDKKIDVMAADRDRAERTMIDPETYRKAAPRPCIACDWLYPVWLAYECGSPEPLQFCTPECAMDKANGLTAKQINDKLARLEGGVG